MNHPKNHWENFPVADEAKILEDFTGSPSKFMVSAFVGDRIVANLGFFGLGGEFLKHNARIGMGIETDFQGLGLGQAMLEYALKIGQSIGFRRAELTVRTFNAAGIGLYEKVGFRRVGRLEETALIDGEYFDEYLYEILLKEK